MSSAPDSVIAEDCLGEAAVYAAEFDHVVRKDQKLTHAQLECFGDKAAEAEAEARGQWGFVRGQRLAQNTDCR